MKNNKRQLVRVGIFLFLSIAFLLSGCELQYSTPVFSTSIPSETNPVMSPFVPTTTNTPEPIVTPDTTPTVETVKEDQDTLYEFSVTLDYNKHILYVDQSITYVNLTGRLLDELELVVPPNQIEEVFVLERVEVDAVEVLDYSLEGYRLSLPFSKSLLEGEVTTIFMKYELTPAYNAGVLSYTKNQMNLSDWYPFIPPYDSERGWIINQPAEVGEYLVYDVADFNMFLAVMNAQDVIVAASTEVVPIDVNMYKLESIDARNLTLSVSNKYQVLPKEFGSTTVRAYVFEGDEDAGWAAIENTGNALLSFSVLFDMPYPNKTLTIVESDFPDGMEYDGLYYLSKTYFREYKGTYQNYLSLLSVHETAHQWWFAMVGSDQANEPWLDEMLATYSEYLYTEQFYPEMTDWWWDYRVEANHPTGKVDSTIYEETELRPYINAVYLQGATFMHELRQALGDEMFFNGLKTYIANYKDKNATWADFLSAMGVDQSTEAAAVVQRYFRNY